MKFKDPSDISKSASEFLKTVPVTSKTLESYDDVLFLFIEALKSDESSVIETDLGELVLISKWEDYWGGAMDNFLDHFLARKVMGPPDLRRKAPGILRKRITWSFNQGYFDKAHYEDYLLALPKSKTKQIDRLETADKLLFDLYSKGTSLLPELGNAASIRKNRKPDGYVEGTMVVTGVNSPFIEVEDEGGNPMALNVGQKLPEVIELGDCMYLEIALFGDTWEVVGSGNVYPGD